MLLIVPHTKSGLSHETIDAVTQHKPLYVETPSDMDDAYFWVLNNLWVTRQDFIIVEQDVVPTHASLDALAACGGWWCGSPYPYLHGDHAGLGCTRFRRELIISEPDLIDTIGLVGNDVHPPKHWCNLDDRITRELNQRGYQMHVHHDYPVGHTDPKPSHGCT